MQKTEGKRGNKLRQARVDEVVKHHFTWKECQHLSGRLPSELAISKGRAIDALRSDTDFATLDDQSLRTIVLEKRPLIYLLLFVHLGSALSGGPLDD